MSTVMMLLSMLLMAVGALFLMRRSALPAFGILALSFIPLALAEPVTKALFTWLALVGLMIMGLVFYRGLNPSKS